MVFLILVIDGVKGFVMILSCWGLMVVWLKFRFGFFNCFGLNLEGFIVLLNGLSCFLFGMDCSWKFGFLVIDGLFIVFDRSEFICDWLSEVYDELMYESM